MNQIFYILIILGSNGVNGTAAVANYDNMLACLNAKHQIEAYRGASNNYSAICTPSFIKKAKD